MDKKKEQKKKPAKTLEEKRAAKREKKNARGQKTTALERREERLFPGACAVGNCARDYMDVLAASPGKGLFVGRSKALTAAAHRGSR